MADDAELPLTPTAACCVCLSAPRERVLTACGHAVLCGTCLSRVCAAPQPRCPLCSLPIPDGAWSDVPAVAQLQAVASYQPMRVDAVAAAAATALQKRAVEALDAPPVDLQALFEQVLDTADDAQRAERISGLLHFFATDDRYAEGLAIMLQRGMPVDVADEDGVTALDVAAATDSVEMARLLLEAGADANHRDNAGLTPLHRAAGADAARVVALLLAHGADVEATGAGELPTPLQVASSERSAAAVAALLAGGASVDAAGGQGMPPLYLAAREGAPFCLRLLLDAGAAAVNAPDPVGNTPLIVAVDGGHAGSVQALLEGSADVNARNSDGATALMVCARAQIEEAANLAQLLLRAGADVRATDGDGWSALHWAARFDQTDLVRALLAAGADAQARTAKGELARALAPRLGGARRLLPHDAAERGLAWAAVHRFQDASAEDLAAVAVGVGAAALLACAVWRLRRRGSE